MAASENKSKAKGKAPPHAWKKGQSGNPGGRPKADPELRVSMRNLTPQIVARITRELEEDGPDWLDASKLALAYGWGRPPAAPEDHEAMTSSSTGLAVLSTSDIVKAVQKLNTDNPESDA